MKQNLTWMIACLLCLLMVCGIASADRLVTATYPPQEITGVVTNAEDGSALAGVAVQANGQSTVTDASGRFRISFPTGLSVTLTFTKEGFEDASASASTSIRTAPADVNVQMVPKKTVLYGTVKDGSNAGGVLAGVQVSCGTFRTTTDASGAYRMEIDPGVYEVSFTRNGYVPTSRNVALYAGDTKQLDVSMQKNEATIHGVVSDAIDPTRKLSGVTVTCGTQTATTDANGRYSMQVEPGSHQLSFAKQGYVSTTQNAQVSAGDSKEVNCSMTQELASNQYRVVLTWGTTPRDLDSHLRGKTRTGSTYHVYYSSKTAGQDAKLDVDDTTSYGPETTTFTVYDGATYRFYVYNYSGEGSMPTSGAKVEVYCGNQRLASYTVPSSGPNGARYWNVFEIVNGQYREINQIVSSEPQ